MYRKIVCIAGAVLMMFSCLTVSAVEQPQTSALSAVLYCADNGEVLYEKAAHEKRAIASITKVMTAVLALEQAAVSDKEVTFTYEMTAEGSSMYLQTGDKLKLSELVKGMMMVSGNDAANAIAVSVSGSREKFADKMNEKARELGMSDTHFVTPSGLDDEMHYSTAYDMALLCSYAMRNERFKEIVSQKSMRVSFVYPENKTQVYRNHNKLLSLYEDCIGIKTGFTKKAGRTLTSCAERDGVRLIAVTLNDGDDWKDHISMYEYGFSVTERMELSDKSDTWEVPVVGSDKQYISAVQENPCSAVAGKGMKEMTVQKVYLPHFVYAPVSKGKILGEVRYSLNGRVIAASKILAAESCLYHS